MSVTCHRSAGPMQVWVDCGSGLGLKGIMLPHQVIDGAFQYGIQAHSTLYIKHYDVWYTGTFCGGRC